MAPTNRQTSTGSAAVSPWNSCLSVIPEYNLEFLLAVSNYLCDFQFPAHIGVCLWWSADEGDQIFRAHLLRQFYDGKTGLDAIMRTTPSRNLEDHCQMLNPNNPKTANRLYFATPLAVNECESLRHLLSPQAKETITRENEDVVNLARRIMGPDTRCAWEDSVEDGF
ncbi:hypothetical protein LX36DRAFT_754180 [Colletotrichum falcatum]|nr:hypothetical protein LX36DRAFT_754180 [Colletotrichum falcatum]